MRVTVRRWTRGDAKQIFAILSASFAPNSRFTNATEPATNGYIEAVRTRGEVFVASSGDRVIGCIMAQQRSFMSAGKLVRVGAVGPNCVLPGFRRAGVGDALLCSAELYLKRRRLSVSMVSTRPGSAGHEHSLHGGYRECFQLEDLTCPASQVTKLDSSSRLCATFDWPAVSTLSHIFAAACKRGEVYIPHTRRYWKWLTNPLFCKPKHSLITLKHKQTPVGYMIVSQRHDTAVIVDTATLPTPSTDGTVAMLQLAAQAASEEGCSRLTMSLCDRPELRSLANKIGMRPSKRHAIMVKYLKGADAAIAQLARMPHRLSCGDIW